MSFILSSNTIKKDSINIETIIWSLLRFNYVLEENCVEEIRTDNPKNFEQVNSNFKLKVQFLGRNNDVIEIYYSISKSVLLKSTLAISTSTNPSRELLSERPLVTYEYQKIQSNKWQYLSTLYKRDILGSGFQDKYLLENGTLKLLFTFHVIVDVVESVPERELSNDFQNLLDSEHFADVTIKSIEGKEFKVHKAMLASRSPFFKAHFEHNFLESCTNMTESAFETDILREILTFIYTAKSPRIDDMAEKLLAAAEFYQLDALKGLCEHALQEKLSVDNAIETLELAELYSANTLKKLTLEFIKDGNTKLIIKTEGWANVKSIDLIKSLYEYIMDSDMCVEKTDET